MHRDILEAFLTEYENQANEVGLEHLDLIYPTILVRVLPKNFVSSKGIILTDAKGAAGTPLYEGIVIKTHPPKEVFLRREAINLDETKKTLTDLIELSDSLVPNPVSSEAINMMVKLSEQLMQESYRDVTLRADCEFKFGDHIMFPHWAGIPVQALEPNVQNENQMRWRVLPTQNALNTRVGHRDSPEPVCKINIERESADKLLIHMLAESCEHRVAVDLTNRIKEEFDIIPKRKTRITGA